MKLSREFLGKMFPFYRRKCMWKCGNPLWFLCEEIHLRLALTCFFVPGRDNSGSSLALTCQHGEAQPTLTFVSWITQTCLHVKGRKQIFSLFKFEWKVISRNFFFNFKCIHRSLFQFQFERKVFSLWTFSFPFEKKFSHQTFRSEKSWRNFRNM